MTTKFTMALSFCLTLAFTHSSRADFSLSFSGEVTSAVGITAGETFHGTLKLHQTGGTPNFIMGTADFHVESGAFSLTKQLEFTAMVASVTLIPSYDVLRMSFDEPGGTFPAATIQMSTPPEISLPSATDFLTNPSLDYFVGGNMHFLVFDPPGRNNPQLHGTITQFTATPEPASLVLFATAFGGLVAGRRTVFRRNA